MRAAAATWLRPGLERTSGLAGVRRVSAGARASGRHPDAARRASRGVADGLLLDLGQRRRVPAGAHGHYFTRDARRAPGGSEELWRRRPGDARRLHPALRQPPVLAVYP